MLTLLVSGCVNAKRINDSAICKSLADPWDEHVDALIEDGGPKSTVTGERLTRGYDAVCKPT